MKGFLVLQIEFQTVYGDKRGNLSASPIIEDEVVETFGTGNSIELFTFQALINGQALVVL